MTPNEQTKGSVPGDGGLRMGKKNKQKKIPQRGLGVAQLEKLRLEEQQKKGASSSSDPSTQGFGFPPPPPPPQQQQQPYFPLATDEGVMRPRVALVVPVNSYPVISMPPPRPVAQDTSMPVLWNAGDPNACDGEAFAKSFGFHVPPGSDLSNTSCRSRTPMTLVRSIHLSLRCHGLLRSTAVLTSPCCLICRRTWHHQRRPWSPLQTKPLRIATTCYLAGESESESERKSERGKRPCPFYPDDISSQTAYPSKLPSPANGIAGFRRDASSSGLHPDRGNKENGSFLTLCPKCSSPNPSFYKPDLGDVGQARKWCTLFHTLLTVITLFFLLDRTCLFAAG
ncbi:uncharacterized protein LOC103969956 isoform X2 [Musa acuminata AAA Group]|uniref:uncharacterized protein LOC103969956 isoform X2 n=1 Tax=Musa acuminata AAA Group TaxID=214697 RepID=UPI0031DCAB5A